MLGVTYFRPEEEKFCQICYCEGPASTFFTLSCLHEFDTECLRDYFMTQIRTNTLEHIQCPDANCRQKPERIEIEKILGRENFA